MTNGTHRTEKVNRLTELFGRHTMVYFTGINGSGKTQLAALVASRFPDCWWLDLRTYNDSQEKCALLIDAFLSHITGLTVEHNRRAWWQRVMAALPANALLVFNDLPRLEEGSVLYKVVDDLLRQAAQYGIRMLGTSNFRPPDVLLHTQPHNAIVQFDDLVFSDEEIRSQQLMNQLFPTASTNM